MALDIHDIKRLLIEHGTHQYGREAVSQLEHALQCSQLAEAAGESEEMVAACLLHDLGHMLNKEKIAAHEHDQGKDDLHQYTLMPFLRPVFSDAVLEPIRMHVDAKRYLCHVETGYFESLSAESVRSLVLQGGIFSNEQANSFISQPHAEEAVRLRRYDDLAKIAGRVTPPLDHYLPRLEQLMPRTA
jgi:phosphonate degradation associated HDIG domain protein